MAAEQTEINSTSKTTRPANIKPIPPLVTDAIATAPPKQLRLILTYLYESNERSRQVISERLIVGGENHLGRKRKAYEKCMNCDMDFHVLQNERGDCVYHEGMLFVSNFTSLQDAQFAKQSDLQVRRRWTTSRIAGMITIPIAMASLSISSMIPTLSMGLYGLAVMAMVVQEVV